jgi:hypothetical protein
VKATARWLIAAVTISSWIAISNHCAFRALTAKAELVESGCPFHSKPAKSQKAGGIECCKVLRAIARTPVKIVPPAIVDLLNVDFRSNEVAALPKIFFAPATLDTGPPGKTSFAELTGSVRANAPPFLV